MIETNQEVKAFYDSKKDVALQACLDEGYKPLSLRDLAEARLDGTAPWIKWAHTTSLRVTGRTNQGSAVVVYAHVPTNLATPEGIREAKEKGLVNYAARFPQDEFQKLVDREDDEAIFVVDHDKFKNAPSDVIPIRKALDHPQTIPFIGGEERAKRYLIGHQEAYNTNKIGVWHVNDLDNESPLARLLFLGYYYDYDDYGLNDGLFGVHLDGSGRFFGVREGAVGTKNVAAYTPQQISKALKNLRLSGIETRVLDALNDLK